MTGRNNMKWLISPVYPLKEHEQPQLSVCEYSFHILGSNITSDKKEAGVLSKMAKSRPGAGRVKPGSSCAVSNNLLKE